MPIDVANSKALLIGVSRYDDDRTTLPDLDRVVNNIQDLEKLLRDETVAGFKDVHPLLNKHHSAIGEAITRVTGNTADTLLIYYAGHGLVNSGDFYLTASDSVRSSISFSGIKFDVFKDAVNRSSAPRKVIILDSCFSGRAIKDMAPDGAIVESNIDDIEGAFTIASADRNQTAPARSAFGHYTGFTDLLLRVISQGAKQVQHEWMSMGELFDAVRNLARDMDDVPTPLCKSTKEIARFRLFRNRAHSLTVDKPDALSSFRDELRTGGHGPEMVVLPALSTGAGTEEGREQYQDKEVQQLPEGTVFAIGRYPVSFQEYDLYCSRSPARKPNREWEGDTMPVINVSLADALKYTTWLSEETQQAYFLPTEQEWEYAASAQQLTKYWWGDDMENNRANYRGCRSGWQEEGTSPVDSFKPNPWELYDMIGNIWEWTSSNGSPQALGIKTQHQSVSARRIIRGGSWYHGLKYLPLRSRRILQEGRRSRSLGFRIARRLGSGS